MRSVKLATLVSSVTTAMSSPFSRSSSNPSLNCKLFARLILSHNERCFCVRNPVMDCESFDSIPRMNLYPWKEVDTGASTGTGGLWNTAEDGVQWSSNCDFVGHNIGSSQSVVDGGQCGRRCIDTRGCNAFWSKEGWCTLKDIPKGLRQTYSENSICGFLPWKL